VPPGIAPHELPLPPRDRLVRRAARSCRRARSRGPCLQATLSLPGGAVLARLTARPLPSSPLFALVRAPQPAARQAHALALADAKVGGRWWAHLALLTQAEGGAGGGGGDDAQKWEAQDAAWRRNWSAIRQLEAARPHPGAVARAAARPPTEIVREQPAAAAPPQAPPAQALYQQPHHQQAPQAPPAQYQQPQAPYYQQQQQQPPRPAHAGGSGGGGEAEMASSSVMLAAPYGQPAYGQSQQAYGQPQQQPAYGQLQQAYGQPQAPQALPAAVYAAAAALPPFPPPRATSPPRAAYYGAQQQQQQYPIAAPR